MSRRLPPFEQRKKYFNPEYAELEKTQNEIREAKIEASKKAYNALNPEKREKVDEIYNQYNLDWKKLGFTNADKKKEQALRKLFKKKWLFDVYYNILYFYYLDFSFFNYRVSA